MNNENVLSNNLPTDLKVQLDILATENRTTTDNLILTILHNYVKDEFEDYDNIIE